MEPEVFSAALAGLVHDIGKLEQRARVDPWNTAPGIDREGQPVHATWTIYFIEHYLPQRYRAAAYAGAYHHRPDQSPSADHRLSELVALADRLSAGERADIAEKEEHPPKQMVTIFDRVKLEKQERAGSWHYLPLRPLALQEEFLFPGDQLKEAQQSEAYDHLCQFLRSAASQPIPDDQAYLENLLAALQQAGWCVPSAFYHSIPDVSLYDHSRMTAALAACLSGLDATSIKQLLQAVQNDFQGQATSEQKALLDEPLVLLVGGDISGIQDFIYTISAKGAAKTLRGRSFYLQLLTEAVLRYVLLELGLPYTNVIYSGGGHFFLLAPLSAEQQLPKLREQITRKLIAHHSVSLYLAIGSARVPASGFHIGKFPDYWAEMHQALSRAKQQRYTELGSDLYQEIFTAPEYGGNPDSTCSVCGEDYRPVQDLDEEREEQSRICSLCSSFDEQIGRQLPDTSFIALGFGQPAETSPGTAAEALWAFGMQFQLLKSASESVSIHNAEHITIWALDDPSKERWPEVNGIGAARSLRYTVNRIPRITFDALQEQVKGGFQRLGVLRMDMDNLGDIFKYGLGETATLARLSTLSFQMSLFFEGWVKKLCEDQHGLVYAVYTGGDDLFLIGPWDIIPALAQSIRADFDRYTANHPAFHLSGGMAFIGGKYPMYQAARDALAAEQQAKDISGKNAFSFLGQAWPWLVFDLLVQKRLRLMHLVTRKAEDGGGLEGPQAILGVLRELAAVEAVAAQEHSRPVWGRWMWIGPYRLKRMAERYKKNNPELAKEIDSLREELAANNYSEINQWGAAARWTQLEVRKSQSEKEA